MWEINVVGTTLASALSSGFGVTTELTDSIALFGAESVIGFEHPGVRGFQRMI